MRLPRLRPSAHAPARNFTRACRPARPSRGLRAPQLRPARAPVAALAPLGAVPRPTDPPPPPTPAGAPSPACPQLILPFGHHAWFRYLFGWSLPASIPLIKATQPPSLTKFYQDRHIAQDGLVPLEKLPQGIEFFHKNFECYPLWLCPHKLCFTSPQGMLRPSKEAVARGLVKPGKWEQYVDIGCYYSPGPILRGEEYDCVQARKNYEQFLIENSGYQALYAITEMTRDQWATMFDTELYDKCRTKYDAVGWFMDAYDKVCRPKGEAAKKRS